jgi:hypothetical protein
MFGISRLARPGDKRVFPPLAASFPPRKQGIAREESELSKQKRLLERGIFDQLVNGKAAQAERARQTLMSDAERRLEMSELLDEPSFEYGAGVTLRISRKPSLGESTASKTEGLIPAQPVSANSGSGSQLDSEAARRAAMLTDYKAKGRGMGIRITDEMVAKAANPKKWNERSMVTWWKRNDPRCKPPSDRRIKNVLSQDPSQFWTAKPKRHPK